MCGSTGSFAGDADWKMCLCVSQFGDEIFGISKLTAVKGRYTGGKIYKENEEYTNSSSQLFVKFFHVKLCS